MKKQTLLPLLAMILMAAGSLSAQISGAVKATVPFDFTAGSISLPAGEYQIASSMHSGTLVLRGKGSSSGMFIGANAAQASTVAQSTKLVFHRYGDRYFLYQLWLRGANLGSELPMTKLEKELRASNARPSSVAILASRK